MSNKTHLRQTMLDLAEGRLRFAEQTYAQYLVGAAGRGDEPSESDAASRAVNNAALAQAFECPIHDHQEALEVLRQIDFGPRDSVETGAVVRIDGRWFVIAVASDAFQCDGNTYMGISTQAPIYAAIADARAGDERLGRAPGLRACAPALFRVPAAACGAWAILSAPVRSVRRDVKYLLSPAGTGRKTAGDGQYLPAG